ncbi:MAG TPA: hypothetical protein VF595_03070 [Tepidisphaeraceae bacterium]
MAGILPAARNTRMASTFDSPLRGVGRTCLVLLGLTLAHLVIQRCFLGANQSPTDLPKLWQFPSVAEMRSLPFQSIWYWHAYPSGFVAYWVALLNLFGEQGGRVACGWIYLIGCSTLPPMVYVIGQALCGSRPASLAAAVIVGLSPSLPLFSAYFVYDAPTMVLVTAVVAGVAMYQLTGIPKWLVGAIAVASVLVLIRAMYHLVILLPLFALLLHARPSWKAVATALAATVPAVGMYLKNYLLFGFFGASSMFGFNYSKMVLWPLEPPEIAHFSATGALTPLVAEYPLFYHMVDGQEIYRKHGYTAVGPSEIVNQNNVNNINLIAISREYGRCARRVLAVYPGSFVQSVSLAVWRFCSPPSRSYWFGQSPARIEPYRTIYLNLFYGEWVGGAVHALTGLEPMPSIVMVVLPLLLIGFAASQVIACGLSWRSWKAAVTSQITLYTAMAFVFYTAVVSSLLEVNENDRYFTYIEPLFVVLTAAGAMLLYRRLRDRRRTLSAGVRTGGR